MPLQPLKTCPITDSRIYSITTHKDYFEYPLVYNDIEYILRLHNETKWEKDDLIKQDDKIILRSLLYNNEWPLEAETVITTQLISQIIRLADYPRNFEEKLDYLLFKCYSNGGKEYKTLKIDTKHVYQAYCHDSDEFNRLLTGLSSKEFIISDTTESKSNFSVTVSLTEKGIKQASLVGGRKTLDEFGPYAYSQGPRIAIVAEENDKIYHARLNDFLLKCGIETVSFEGITDKNRFSNYESFRNGLYSEENDYVIFIKSINSDSSNSVGTLIDIAIEAQRSVGKQNFDYLFFACIDDSEVDSRPRIIDYHSKFYDFRITTNRNRLLQAIDKDWKKRLLQQESRSKYKFPVYNLSKDETLWLKTIYEKFLTDEPFQPDHLLAPLWDIVPNDFDPGKIPEVLVHHSKITILGINCIDPSSRLIPLFEKVIYAIRDILKEKGKTDRIESEEIITKVPGITDEEVYQIFRLIHSMDGLSNGFGKGEYGSSLSINDSVYETYRKFNGLEGLIQTFIRNNSGENVEEIKTHIPPLLNTKIDHTQIHSYKTPFSLRDTNNIKPVMGVLNLAEDLTEIIDSLPTEKEKGQMIGIFGKWGRGKTFLFKEVWKKLSQKTATEYIKIEFHAWKYQETPASWAYLYENFIDVYLTGNWFKKRYNILILNISRLGYWPVMRNALLVISLIAIGYCSTKLLEVYGSITVMSIELSLLITLFKKFSKEFSLKAIDLIRLYGVKNSFKDTLGLQAEIQKELIDLLKVWIPKKSVGKKKIILFVDDIDRCTEDRIIQNIDSLRVLLEDDEISKRVIIVAAVDERILKNAILTKYSEFLANNQKNNLNQLVSEYLDKLFILAIKLGALSNDQKDEFILELIDQEIDNGELNDYYENKKFQQQQNDSQTTGFAYDKTETSINHPLIKEINESFIKNEKAIRQASIEVDKEGDNSSIKEQNGKSTTISEDDQLIQDRIKTQLEFRRLSPIEVDVFKQAAKMLSDATPRKIRIFYYRYLLTKNLLINKYDQLQLPNLWQNEAGISVLMKIILDYSNSFDFEHILVEKNSAVKSMEVGIIETGINNETVTIPKDDYTILHDILEIVIAY
jgi:KAP family P-loop domain